jgi:glyoxylase-like metal-dependent hydrolase (beta-lactamase superfamily II)
MRFETFIVGMYQTNTYVVYDENSREALVIDPGDMPKTIIHCVQKLSLKPVGIVLTHHHIDHVGAVEKLKKVYDCPIYIHKRDEAGLQELIEQGMALLKRKIEVRPDRLVNDGDLITAGQVTLKVIYTPGHTPGSICLEAVGEKVVFTGDTVFADSIGRYDLQGGDQLAMRRSLTERVNKWGDDVMICPGHDHAATMGEVRAKNRIYRMMVGLEKR